MTLSILIISIGERFDKLITLYNKINDQIKDYPVEIICFTDNRKRTIGEKRTGALSLAKGKYVSMIDDDDDVASNFIEMLMMETEYDPDVITFCQVANIDGDPMTVNFGMRWNNDPAERGDNGQFKPINRKPFQMCAYKRELVKDCVFPSMNYGEDSLWVDCAVKNCKKERHIDKVLHYYNFSSELTRAI